MQTCIPRRILSISERYPQMMIINSFINISHYARLNSDITILVGLSERGCILASLLFLQSLSRRIPAQTLTLNTINPNIAPKPARPIGDLNLPIDIIKAASYECHEDAPRWWKRGVMTSPFSRCISSFPSGPERIFKSFLFF
jgi:hypothetical protein